MKRYISKAKLAERLLASPIFKNTQNGDLIRDTVIDIVLDYPTADVDEVRHGRWEVYFDGKELMCSSCKATFWDEDGSGGTNFCPNCGAKMDGERREDNEG